MKLYIDKELIEMYTRQQRHLTIGNTLSFLESNNRIIYEVEIDGETHKFPYAVLDKIYDDFVNDVKFTTIDISAYLDILLGKCTVKLEGFYKELNDILNDLRSFEEGYIFEFATSFFLFIEDLKGVCHSIYNNLGIESLFIGEKFNTLLKDLKLVYDMEDVTELSEFLFFEVDPLFNSWITETKKLYTRNQDILRNNDNSIYISSLYKFINNLNISNPNIYEEDIHGYNYETNIYNDSVNRDVSESSEEIEVEEIKEEESSEEIEVEEIKEEESSEEIGVEEIKEEESSEEIEVEEIKEEESSEEIEEVFKDSISECRTLDIFDKLYSIYEKKH